MQIKVETAQDKSSRVNSENDCWGYFFFWFAALRRRPTAAQIWVSGRQVAFDLGGICIHMLLASIGRQRAHSRRKRQIHSIHVPGSPPAPFRLLSNSAVIKAIQWRIKYTKRKRNGKLPRAACRRTGRNFAQTRRFPLWNASIGPEREHFIKILVKVSK